MPKVDCCGKELKDCKCGRSRTPERREREAKAATDKADQAKESPPAWALSMKNDILQGVRGAVQEELKPMKEDIARVKESVSAIEDRVGRAEADIKEIKGVQQAERVDEKFETRMKDLEDKLSDSARKVIEDTSTVLFGGLQSLSFDDAEAWIKEQIKDRKLEDPEIVYYKGDKFAGLAFAKFASSTAAENVIKKMAKIQKGDEEVYCKKDLPLEQRVPLSFLLGLRRQLITWGFTKRKPRVNEYSNTLTVGGGNPVLKVTVGGNRLVLEWMSQDWKDWKELAESSEFKKLKEKAEETLSKAEDKGKGDGKGKTGH